MEVIISAIKIIFLLGFLILIHELGHFIAARLCGVKVKEFSIGFGKKLFEKVTKNTVYSIRVLPLGGYVSLKGLDQENDDVDSYTSVSLFKRIVIILAGALVNIIFGIVVYFILISVMYDIQIAFTTTIDFVKNIFVSLQMIFTGHLQMEQLTGPVGISNMVTETKAISEFIYLLAVVSLSLGITNLLPIPPLDGFKFILLIIEGIRRKSISKKLEYSLQYLGFLALFVLSIVVTYNDIIKIV